MNKQINLSENLKILSEIATWFDEQETVDVEEGLVKVKQAATIIKESKLRLKAIENEFKEIKREIDTEDTSRENFPVTEEITVVTVEKSSDPDDMPF